MAVTVPPSSQAAATGALDTERAVPRLAAGVELIGRYEGSGLEKPISSPHPPDSWDTEYPELSEFQRLARRLLPLQQNVLLADGRTREALGTLRLARQFEAADAFIAAHASQIPAGWKPAWDNEVAALMWQRGRHGEAARLWAALPESVPVLFNRGMAALFQDRPGEARTSLKSAVAGLPESSAWHHLGRLYLAKLFQPGSAVRAFRKMQLHGPEVGGSQLPIQISGKLVLNMGHSLNSGFSLK